MFEFSISREAVNAECKRRITDRFTLEKQINNITAGTVPPEQPEWVAANVEAGKALKAMTPIPHDFADDKYWPERPDE